MAARSFRVWWACCFLMSLVGASSKCSAAENYAFLVAVGDYDIKQLKPLAYTRHDVLEFAKALTDTGFKSENIVLMHDDLKTLKSQRYLPQAEKIRKEFDLLLSSVGDGDAVIVAFAGHGVQFEGDDRNFFCPIDADLEEPKRRSLISLKEIYTKLEACQADRKLLLVDACRNDPLSKLSRSREKVKLNSVTRPQIEPVPKGIVALFSCSAGQESYEWPDLEHGVFFHQILSGWKGAADTGDQELSLDELVAYTRKNTQTFARLKLGAIQTPQLKGEFNGTWVLRKFGGGSNEYTSQSTGMKFALIPAGEFKMGSSTADVRAALQADSTLKEEDESFKSEQPQHPVRITKPFYMGVYEVTQGEFQKVLGRNTSQFSPTGKGSNQVSGLNTTRFPVEYVTWFDAVEFCNKLSAADGRTPYYRLTSVDRRTDQSVKKASATVAGGSGYRLPTEAEWEYACRATTTTPFHFGSVLNGEKANVDGNSPFGTKTKGAYLERTTAVDDPKYLKNAFGLAQMHGNVYEWCEDVYDESAYAGRSQTTPTLNPLVTSGSEDRVLRGGTWLLISRVARSASRNSIFSDGRDDGLGFRVVCSSSP